MLNNYFLNEIKNSCEYRNKKLEELRYVGSKLKDQFVNLIQLIIVK